MVHQTSQPNLVSDIMKYNVLLHMLSEHFMLIVAITLAACSHAITIFW